MSSKLTMNCKKCNAEFDTYIANQVFCSKKCRVEYWREYERADRKNPFFRRKIER